MIENLQQDKERLEQQHQDNMRTLKKNHRTEIFNQKHSFESRLNQIESRHSLNIEQKELELNTFKDQISSQPSSVKIESISDLLNAYPVYMANYRSHFEKLSNNSKEISQLKQEQIITIRQLEQSFQLQKDKYKDRHNFDLEALKHCNETLERTKTEYLKQNHDQEVKWQNEMDGLRQHHQSESASITTRIKEQCSAAYDTALVKLKGEYYKLEQHLRTKFEKDSITLQQMFDKRYSGHTTKKEYESKERDLESLRQTSKAELETVKRKYVQTLKRMRDELQINKKKSWERLETEWVKRKQKINDEWKNK
jgi:hypothetical protein